MIYELDSDKLDTSIKVILWAVVLGLITSSILIVVMIWVPIEYISFMVKLLLSDILVTIICLYYCSVTIYEPGRGNNDELVIRKEYRKDGEY